MFSIKRKIRKLHVAVVQWRQRNVQKKCNARAEFRVVLKLVLFFAVAAVVVVD